MDQKSSLLDRSYQNEVLAFLLKDYPEYEHTDAFCSDLLIKNDLKYYANLMYLEMHELMLPSQSHVIRDWKGILGAVAPILVTVQYGL